MGLGYTYDPVANLESGPLVPWTYTVSGVALLAIAVVTSWSRHWPTVLLLAPVLVGAWSFTASREDDSGLWIVGLIYMTFYTVVATLAVLGVTRLARRQSDRRKSSVAPPRRRPPMID